MKKKHLLLGLFLFIVSIRVAGGVPFAGKEQEKQFLHSQPVQFLENKGQMIDLNGKPVSFVLFKVEAPNMNMFVTEKGITYMPFEANENEEFENQTKEESEVVVQEKYERNIINWSRVDVELKGAIIKKDNIIAEGKSTWDKRYYLPHCPNGIVGVNEYQKVTIKDIYPGIDWVLYNAEKNGLKYDFVVHPGADYKQIKLVYRSAQKLYIDKEGNIQIDTKNGKITEQNPVSYNEETYENIPTKFILTSVSSCTPTGFDRGYETEIRFNLEKKLLQPDKTIIIDPQLTWYTFFGGNGLDGFVSNAVDNSNNVFIVSYSGSANIPTQIWGTAYFDNTNNSSLGQSVVLLRFSNSGNLTWATYFQGDVGEELSDGCMCLDPAGNIYITGGTRSTSLPIQSWGTAYFDNAIGGGYDMFIARFTNNGVLQWCTYFGGNAGTNGTAELGSNIATDAFGNVYITGLTWSTNFPTQGWGAAYFDNSLTGTKNFFIVRFSNTGNLDWSSYFGGTNTNNQRPKVTADISGNVYLAGIASSGMPLLAWGAAYFDNTQNGLHDVFISRFSNVGILQWSTYFGGTGEDLVRSLKTDISGNIFITGVTSSANLPKVSWGTAYFDNILGGGDDAFISRFSTTGNLTWSTYFGGTGNELNASGLSAHSIVFDKCNNFYIGIETASTDITIINPGCGSYYVDASFNGGTSDNFIMKFNPIGTLLWSTYFGGDGKDFRNLLSIDSNNNLFLAGECRAWITGVASGTDPGYPLVNPGGGAYFQAISGGSEESFIAKFIPPVLTLTPFVTSAGCSCIGTASSTVTGGCAPYKYAWYNSIWTALGNTQTISNLCPGNYQLIVRDTINCIKADTAVVTINGGGLALNNSTNNVLCNGDNTGSVTVAPAGGIPNYTYSWNNGQTTQTATGLSAGNYTITVTDSGGCSSTTATVIISPLPLIGQITKGTANCTACGCKEWLIVNAAGGISPYTYTWSDGYKNRYKNQLCPGAYTVKVVDKNGCNTNLIVNAP